MWQFLDVIYLFHWLRFSCSINKYSWWMLHFDGLEATVYETSLYLAWASRCKIFWDIIKIFELAIDVFYISVSHISDVNVVTLSSVYEQDKRCFKVRFTQVSTEPHIMVVWCSQKLDGLIKFELWCRRTYTLMDIIWILTDLWNVVVSLYVGHASTVNTSDSQQKIHCCSC